MLFLISLALAILFAAFSAPLLRRAPLPFYCAALLLAAAAAAASELDVENVLLSDWILPLFNKSAAAAALWALVMWTGALPRGSAAVKRLMAVRGELSILAAILTLSHSVVKGLLYLRQLQKPRFSPDGVFILTSIAVLLMLLIMLPLTVLSFRKIRRKISPGRWKRIQRLAYPFYGLIFIHVLVLYLPPALHGVRGYPLTVAAYAAVWIAYLIFRLFKRKSCTGCEEKPGGAEPVRE